MNDILLWMIFIFGGFLLGSVMFCSLLPQIIAHVNISEISDDGNPGAFNVFKHCGATLGIPCVLLDILKGFIPVFVAGFFVNKNSALFTLVIVAPVLGHAIGISNRFRGGKCIATSFGVTAGLIPTSFIVLLLAVLYILFSTVIKIKPNIWRSIVTFSMFGIGALIVLIAENYISLAIGCFLVAVIASVKHIIPLVQEKRQKADIVL